MLIQGTPFNDTNLLGTADRDEIYGGGGADTIIGGAGNDYMEGGDGPDSFRFQPGDGWDCIGDFQQSVDLLDLRAFTAIDSRATLNSLVTADGDDVVITFSPDSSVRLVGVGYEAFTTGPLNVAFARPDEPVPETDRTIYMMDGSAIEQDEGDSGSVTDFVFRVGRTGDLSQAVSVDWSSIGPYPRWDTSYTPASFDDFVPGQGSFAQGLPRGTLTFAAGQAVATIHVAVQGDDTAESRDRFDVGLHASSLPAGWTVGKDSVAAYIRDDDSIPSINGTGGRDILFGTDGNDVIIGRGGDDYMEGGAGSDRFVFGPGEGWDYIGDFQAGEGGDVLDLRGMGGIHSLGDLAIASDLDGTTISFSDSASVRLASVTAGQLTASNILFG